MISTICYLTLLTLTLFDIFENSLAREGKFQPYYKICRLFIITNLYTSGFLTNVSSME